MSDSDFRRDEDIRRGEAFARDGYVIEAVEDRAALDRLRWLMVDIACGYLGVSRPEDAEAWLDHIGELVAVERLNAFRLAVITGLNAEPWVRRAYYDLARGALDSLVGNELAMQRRINLSIQIQDDDSSLLPLHSDAWAGDSPFEVVVWVPFTRCFDTKAMFLLPPADYPDFAAAMNRFKTTGVEAAYQSVSDKLRFLSIDYGQFLLFNQILPHGNRVNREDTTRWSTNCRFKGLFTPYADKKLGEFFEPITIRPASRVGLEYELPGGFE